MGSASTLGSLIPIAEMVREGATTSNEEVVQWVTEVAELTKPSAVVWCDGSQDEWNRITSEMVETGSLIQLNKDLRPGSFLARSHPGRLGVGQSGVHPISLGRFMTLSANDDARRPSVHAAFSQWAYSEGSAWLVSELS